MLDQSKIPKFIINLVNDYLYPSLPRTDYDYLVLMALYGTSKILCYNRMTLQSDVLRIRSNDTFPNIYIMSLAGSGSGKDRGVATLKCLLSKFTQETKTEYSDYYSSKIAETEREADTLNLKGNRRKEHIDNGTPRFLKMEIDSRATLEAFLAQREAFMNAEFGCTCWEDSEIFGTIKAMNKNPNSMMFLDSNKEAFDHGDNDGKAIKSNKKPIDICNVPHLVSIHGAVDSEDDANLFKSFFDLGWARRLFVSMEPKNKTFEKMSLIYKKSLALKAKQNEQTYIDAFYNIYENTKQKQIAHPYDRKVFTFTEGAEDLIENYDEDCQERAFKINSCNDKGIKIEICNRSWKAIKLSAIVCALECANEAYSDKREFVITKEHAEIAIYLTEYFGKHFADFYNLEKDSIEQRFVDFIIKNGETTKHDLTKSSVLTGTYSQRQDLIYRLIDKGSLQEYLNTINKTLIVNLKGKTRKAEVYSIEDIPEHQPYLSDYEIKMSQGFSNKEDDATLDNVIVKFEELHKIVQADVNYCPSRFKDNHRKTENWTQENNLIVIDVDNDISEERQLKIETVREVLKNYTFLIMPTRSHLKDKKDHGIRERFRILIPTTPIKNLTKEEYQEVTLNALANFNLDYHFKKETWVDVGALKDPTRAYHGFNSEPIYNYGLLFNWKTCKPAYAVKKYSEKETNFKNPFPIDTILTIKGKQMSFPEYSYMAKMANGKTTPCLCPFHGEKNPSAHFSINNFGSFMFCCSACGDNKFCNV